MRWMFAAVAAFLLTGVAAFAQAPTAPLDPTPAASTASIPPSRCGPVAAEPPQLPDGARATRADMTRAGQAYDAWAQQVQTVLQCRRGEAEELRTAAEAATAHAETRVREFNAGAARLNSVGAAWKQEADEFNNRGRRRN